MEEAIKRAIEGGYIAEPFYAEKTYTGFNERNRAILDPLFWQALGKAEGWDDRNCFICKRKLGGDNECIEHGWNHYWKDAWHRYIDHLIEGRDPEEFWKDLLVKK